MNFKVKDSIFLFLFVILFSNKSYSFSFFNSNKQEKNNYASKEEKREFPFMQGGALHVENENNENGTVSGNNMVNGGTISIINTTNRPFHQSAGTVTVNGKTYHGKNISIVGDRVIIDGEEFKALSNDIIVEGHDKGLIELLIKTESNDGDLECVDSEIQIDEKNAFIKTKYKTKDCQAHRTYSLKIPKETFIKLLLAKQGSITAENIDNTIEKAQNDIGNITLRNIQGDTQAKTGVGNIVMDTINGKATAKTEVGKIALKSIKDAANAQTTTGTIVLELGDYPNANINASTTVGTCKSEVPVEGTNKNTTIEGTVGHGGPLKTLETGVGNITIKK